MPALVGTATRSATSRGSCWRSVRHTSVRTLSVARAPSARPPRRVADGHNAGKSVSSDLPGPNDPICGGQSGEGAPLGLRKRDFDLC